MSKTYDDVQPGDTIDHEPTGQELVILEERDHAPAPASILPSEREWAATIAVAEQIAATQFVPESYRGQPEAVVAAILTGREMGIGPMQALRQIHMIDGRPAFAADLMLARMRQGGVVIVASDVNDERAWIHARRSDTGEEAEVEWTYEEATRISRKGKPLTDGANWKNYRQDMLWARCVGRLARRLGSDLLGGLVYSAEETRDMEPDDGPGYAAKAERKIDPSRALLTGAIEVTDADTAQAVRDAIAALDPEQDWALIEAEAAAVASGKPMNEWGNSPVLWGHHWKRLANTVIRAQDLAESADFVGHDHITEAFAWAFAGYTPTLRAPQAPEGHDSTNLTGGDDAAPEEAAGRGTDTTTTKEATTDAGNDDGDAERPPA